MKPFLNPFAVIPLMILVLTAYAQTQQQTTMKQTNLTESSIDKQVNLIDKITIPASAVPAYSEKSVYIRTILEQQPGFVTFKIFEHKDENDNLTILTIATWASQQHMDNARSVIQTEMKKAGVNMPEFLKQQGIIIERGVYYSVEE